MSPSLPLDPEDAPKHSLPKGSWALILSYFFTTWATRMDEWSISPPEIHSSNARCHLPQNLFYMSFHSLSQSVASILFAPYVGALVERLPKLGIALATMMLWWLQKEGLDLGLFAGAVVCSSAVRLANMGTTIAVERDWVVVMAGGKSDKLTALNTHLRRIDLICKLAAPLFVSFIASYISVPTTMLIVTVWCLQLFRLSLSSQLQKTLTIPPADGLEREETNPISRLIVYYNHPIFLSSLAVSCLYFTSLSFSGVMITYLLDQGYTPSFLSVMRGLAVISGLSATITLPNLVSSIGLVRSGLWGIWSELALLVPMMAAVVMLQFGWDGGNMGVTVALFAGVVVSRWGLWTFDLCIPEDVGIINGAQFSLQNLAELLSYAVTIVFYLPSQFWISAILSTAGVFIGCITYTIYARRMRGHLFHFDKLAKWGGAVFRWKPSRIVLAQPTSESVYGTIGANSRSGD
ncbi:hypothetical protein BC829DRAFT_404059 [Chytridium lagenaria]|nr:hypothetical protein BC829DRAFT_404059 [Chytridium lagenaria]